MVDPVKLTQDLIRCQTVTPNEGGALVLLEGLLSEAGFVCHRIDVNGICNLYARWGEAQPNLCFAGHTDVVPTGDPASWTYPPFSAMIADDRVWGRGACDMKSGVAAFVCAVISYTQNNADNKGSLSLLITGDEEADAEFGTRALIDWLKARGEKIDHCIVGEPTSVESVGDTIKIGRRGSFTGYLTVTGQQGHVAYPHKAANPLPVLVKLCDRLASKQLDEGTPHFAPSTLALTTIDVGNTVTNIIPAKATATFNIRFNDLHTSATLLAWVESEIKAVETKGVQIDLRPVASSESFLTPESNFTKLVQEVVERQTGLRPKLDTGGGTSDARFMTHVCPTLELGLLSATLHKINENVLTKDIYTLYSIYCSIIEDYFANQ